MAKTVFGMPGMVTKPGGEKTPDGPTETTPENTPESTGAAQASADAPEETEAKAEAPSAEASETMGNGAEVSSAETAETASTQAIATMGRNHDTSPKSEPKIPFEGSKPAPSRPSMAKPVVASEARPSQPPGSPFRKVEGDEKNKTVFGFPSVKPHGKSGGVPLARPSTPPGPGAAPFARTSSPPTGNTPPLGLPSKPPAARDSKSLSGAGVPRQSEDDIAFKETMLGMSAVTREAAAEKVAETVDNAQPMEAAENQVAFEATVQAGADSPVSPGDFVGIRPPGASKTLLFIILVAVGVTVAAVLVNMFVLSARISSVPMPPAAIQAVQAPQTGIPTVQPLAPAAAPAPVAPTPAAPTPAAAPN
jgi:hypothetical protein